MNEKRHYATVAPAGEPYIARVGDATIARSERAMLLEEVKDGTHYPVVVYFPRADVAAGALLPSDRHSRCPIKGEAGYFSVKAGSETLENAAWHYPDPLPDAAPVKDHVAFYPDKVTVEKV
ncbi:MAG TPA: DUF427 domain-containing protein [Kiloniellaceae bacterium]